MGVYAIKCRVNGKVYVGSSSELRRRLREHLRVLDAGSHRNIHLQRAWKNEDGRCYFTFFVLEGVKNEEDLIAREDFWVKKLRALDDRYGYNLTEPSEWPVQAARDYVVTNPEGMEIPVHNLHKFCRQHGLKSASMTAIAQGRVPYYRDGWLCRYAEETKEQWEVKQQALMTRRRKASKIWTFGYIVTMPDGEETEVHILKPWCISRGLSPTALARVAVGQAIHHKGYRARKLGTSVEQWQSLFLEIKPFIRVQFPDGRIEEVTDLKAFAARESLSYTFIFPKMRDKKPYRGFRFTRIGRKMVHGLRRQ